MGTLDTHFVNHRLHVILVLVFIVALRYRKSDLNLLNILKELFNLKMLKQESSIGLPIELRENERVVSASQFRENVMLMDYYMAGFLGI